MRFLLDHNVPANVGDLLRDRGHDVVTVVDVLTHDAKDPVVAAAAMEQARVLVSHDRDMRRVERMISNSHRERYPALSRLHLSCNEVASADRLLSFIDTVEAEYAYLTARGEPTVIDVGDRRARLIR